MIALKHLLTLLPPSRLEQIACAYELASHQQIRLSGPSVFMCLLNGLLNHNELTLRLLEETYHQQTGHSADHSSFGKCLARINPDYFADLFAHLHAPLSAQATPGELGALRLRFVDATTVSLSAKLLCFGLLAGSGGQAKSRRQVKSVLELSAQGLPNFLHVCKDPSEAADSIALGVTMQQHSQPGDLWIFDKGVHGRDRLLNIAKQQAYWRTPHNQQGRRVDRVLLEADWTHLPTMPAQNGAPSVVLVRVEQAVFANGRPTRKWEKMPLIVVHALRYDKRTKSWKPLCLMTNLPLSQDGLQAGPYTFLQLCELYRLRWDIEVFFKFVKQHLSYSHLTSRCENGIKILIYMSLIAALLLIWYKRHSGMDRGWRSVKFWLAENVRAWTQELLQIPPLVPDG